MFFDFLNITIYLIIPSALPIQLYYCQLEKFSFLSNNKKITHPTWVSDFSWQALTKKIFCVIFCTDSNCLIYKLYFANIFPFET